MTQNLENSPLIHIRNASAALRSLSVWLRNPGTRPLDPAQSPIFVAFRELHLATGQLSTDNPAPLHKAATLDELRWLKKELSDVTSLLDASCRYFSDWGNLRASLLDGYTAAGTPAVGSSRSIQARWSA